MGFVVSGPVVIPKLYNGKNKTFWFYAWEANKWIVPGQFTGTVPAAEQRQGDFSQLLRSGAVYQIYDPRTARMEGGVPEVANVFLSYEEGTWFSVPMKLEGDRWTAALPGAQASYRYFIAAADTRSELLIENAVPEHMLVARHMLEKLGVEVRLSSRVTAIHDDGVKIGDEWMDIIAVILNQRYNWRMGQVSFLFNFVLFCAGLAFLNVNLVLYSLAMVFLTSTVMEQVLGMFNDRKLVLIISDHYNEINEAITVKLRRGVTVLHGEGGYTHAQKEILLTVVNNIQIKRLEELVYTIDPKAFTIFSSASNVLGEGFSRRRIY